MNTGSPSRNFQFAPERQQAILELIQDLGKVSVQELADKFNVAPITIRRDLDFLAQSNKVIRVHGGAILPQERTAYEPLYSEKTVINQKLKEQIGRAAADLVADGQTIFIDSGSTAYQLAVHLQGKKNLTVITPDLYVAVALSANSDTQVIVAGGLVRPHQFNCIGGYAEQIARSLNADTFFLAVDGVDIEKGVTVTNIAEARLKQFMISASQQTVMITDHTKFGRVAMANVVELTRVDHIITDSDIHPMFVDALAQLDVRVTYTPV